MSRYGPDNNNWRGGRSMTSHGYVLLRLPGHPLADVRGYVYEHRIVASQAIGRWVLPAEDVHHMNGVRSDNRPENLEVLTKPEHRYEHRYSGAALQGPCEDNFEIQCACGCGSVFLRYDGDGRPRTWLPGHNPHRSESTAIVLRSLEDGPKRVADIVGDYPAGLGPLRTILCRLAKNGIIKRQGGGLYSLQDC